MSKSKAGRKPLPYETIVMRVPKPLKKDIESMVKVYRERNKKDKDNE